MYGGEGGGGTAHWRALSRYRCGRDGPTCISRRANAVNYIHSSAGRRNRYGPRRFAQRFSGIATGLQLAAVNDLLDSAGDACYSPHEALARAGDDGFGIANLEGDPWQSIGDAPPPDGESRGWEPLQVRPPMHAAAIAVLPTDDAERPHGRQAADPVHAAVSVYDDDSASSGASPSASPVSPVSLPPSQLGALPTGSSHAEADATVGPPAAAQADRRARAGAAETIGPLARRVYWTEEDEEVARASQACRWNRTDQSARRRTAHALATAAQTPAFTRTRRL